MNSCCQTPITIKSKSKICFGPAEELLHELLPEGRRVIVISDINIDRCHSSLIGKWDKILVGTGETIKTLQSVDRLYSQLIELGADRHTFILAIGGGIVTDIAGFVASTYMRGLEFGFVPTTLLSQVDASVGGKNGVNVGGFKNMVGTFSQPQFVLIDTSLLSTLSDREFRAGVSEMIKGAIIGDMQLFESLERLSFEELRGDKTLAERFVVSAVRVKAKIVEGDECERGERRKLNFGHSVAHAIESSSGAMNHGEAVAVGVVAAAEIALGLGLLSECDFHRIKSIYIRYGFNLTSPVSRRKIVEAMAKDKKNEGAVLHFVLPEGIGRCKVEPMSIEQLSALLPIP